MIAETSEMHEETRPYGLSATYSPEDNKLRLYSATRLDKETYERVRGAGFIWAPKQELFVAPMWTPERADLLLELCGEIDDEDMSLVDRAEDRADRFEIYSDKRASDADRAHKAVAAIADNIPLGQPILVGRHSERHARKDAARIENGMRKAVRMWETSKYWERRAKGALAHAKYKELPGVRLRRIKGLEADRRKHERTIADAETFSKLWSAPELTREKALKVANYDRALPFGTWSGLDKSETAPEAARDLALERHAARIANARQWIAHLDLRLTYERTMLGDVPAPVKRRRELAPMANYPGEGFAHMTKAEWAKLHKDYKGTRIVRGARVRSAMIRGGLSAVFLTDSKRVDPPSEGSDVPPRFNERSIEVRSTRLPAPAPEPTVFDAMKQSLRAGVKTVSAPQLFATPAGLAARVIEAAQIEPHHTVLEPSAGTGALLRAIKHAARVTAIEVNVALVQELLRVNEQARCANFLDCHDLGAFDRVVMNPPFADGQDVAHVTHAFGFLKPGGRLVAIMSAGVEFRNDRKTRKFRRLVASVGGTIEHLPEDSFKSSGTGVLTVLVTMRREEVIKIT